MPKINWTRPTRRMGGIPHPPYTDTESYDEYMRQMAEATPAEQAGVFKANQKIAMQQTDRIGTSGGDKNYKTWSEYNPEDPNRPGLPPLPSGKGSGGSRDDLRTDQYMYAAAQATPTGRVNAMGETLKGMKDSRSKQFLALYGPGGPLNRMAGDVDPKLKVRLEEALRPAPGGASSGFVSFVGPYNPSLDYAEAARLYKGLRAAKQKVRR